ncbi:MAG: cation transporter [Kurthia sp.]|nr:cation transporter [Candidatus Kurthia equi]
MEQTKNNQRVLFISFIIITLYMVVEAIGGYVTNSLALLSDAGHMVSDSISLAIALIAFKLAEKVANHGKTYGYKRFEILAAVINGVTLIIIALYIFYEAIQRFQNPPEVATTGMLLISSIGLIVNIVVAYIMFKGSNTEDNLNMRGAYMHVISDMLGSIGAIIAGLLILFFGWGWADPAASVIVAVLVLRSGFKVTMASVHILMEGTPKDVEIDELVAILSKQKEVQSVHDLHVWTITSGLNALSCHLVVPDELTILESTTLLAELEHQLGHKGIHHVTIQLEAVSQKHGNDLLCNIKAEIDPHAGHNH